MDLRSDDAFWPVKNAIPQTFPRLVKHERCEVVVLGGGITGALIAESLTNVGIHTMVIDKRQIAHGSTSASTALLQYEIDEPLYSLAQKIGKEDAITAYVLCAKAIDGIERLTKNLDQDCGFQKRPSLYFSHHSHDTISLEKEYQARKEAGFEVELLGPSEIKDTYNFDAKSAIRSKQGAQIDPYLFTYALLGAVQKRGGEVFESTHIVDIQTHNGVTLTSQEGYTIQAKKMIFATGYEAKNYLKEKTAILKSTYACVSHPIDEKLLWHEKCLLWNTDDPYFYARTTDNHRILIGGEDIDYEDDEIRDNLIPKKRRALLNTFRNLFPHIPIRIEYAWAGTFGETKDALPYIGKSSEWDNAYFALGYGGNGMTFSAVAAQALTDLHLGKECSYLHLFRFGR